MANILRMFIQNAHLEETLTQRCKDDQIRQRRWRLETFKWVKGVSGLCILFFIDINGKSKRGKDVLLLDCVLSRYPLIMLVSSERPYNIRKDLAYGDPTEM